MTDIVDRLLAIAAMDLRTGHFLAHTLDTAKEGAVEIKRLRDDRWQHGAESMRQTILQLLPDDQHCDPRQVADMIRSIGLPVGLEQKASENG